MTIPTQSSRHPDLYDKDGFFKSSTNVSVKKPMDGFGRNKMSSVDAISYSDQRDDIEDTRSSFKPIENGIESNFEPNLKALRGRLEKSSNTVVVDLEKFYKTQRAQVLTDQNKKKEALNYLHDFEGVVDLEKFYMTQRAQLLTDQNKKREALDYLHDFEGLHINSGYFAQGRTITPTHSSLISPSMESFCKSPQHQFSPAAFSNVLVDYKSLNYFTFVFVVHQEHGLLILQQYTKTDPMMPLFGAPGGKIFEGDFVAAARRKNDANNQLSYAARTRAARHLYELAGLDVRSRLYRLESLMLRVESFGFEHRKGLLQNEMQNDLGRHIFYLLVVSDDDFVTNEKSDFDESPMLKSPRLRKPLGNKQSNLMLRLSPESAGFVFEREPAVAAEFLKTQASGLVSEALLQAKKTGSKPHSRPFASPACIIEKLELPQSRYKPKHDTSPLDISTSAAAKIREQTVSSIPNNAKKVRSKGKDICRTVVKEERCDENSVDFPAEGWNSSWDIDDDAAARKSEGFVIGEGKSAKLVDEKCSRNKYCNNNMQYAPSEKLLGKSFFLENECRDDLDVTSATAPNTDDVREDTDNTPEEREIQENLSSTIIINELKLEDSWNDSDSGKLTETSATGLVNPKKEQKAVTCSCWPWQRKIDFD